MCVVNVFRLKNIRRVSELFKRFERFERFGCFECFECFWCFLVSNTRNTRNIQRIQIWDGCLSTTADIGFIISAADDCYECPFIVERRPEGNENECDRTSHLSHSFAMLAFLCVHSILVYCTNF